MFKAYNSFLLLAVPFFLLAANLMNAAGITDRLMNLSRAMVGHLPGGLGHVNVTVSMLFAGISGSSTADSAGIGAIMIPTMKEEGYDTSVAVTVTACSSVIGVIIPPSVLMIIWGGVMSVSIGGLFLAGVLPGLALGLSMMVTVYVYARRRGYPQYPRAAFGAVVRSFGKAFGALLTPLIIVGGIAGGFFTPTEAAFIAVVYALIIGLMGYRTRGCAERCDHPPRADAPGAAIDYLAAGCHPLPAPMAHAVIGVRRATCYAAVPPSSGINVRCCIAQDLAKYLTSSGNITNQ